MADDLLGSLEEEVTACSLTGRFRTDYGDDDRALLGEEEEATDDYSSRSLVEESGTTQTLPYFSLEVADSIDQTSAITLGKSSKEQVASVFDLLGSIEDDPELLERLGTGKLRAPDTISIYTCYSSDAESDDEEFLSTHDTPAMSQPTSTSTSSNVSKPGVSNQVSNERNAAAKDEQQPKGPARPPPPAPKASSPEDSVPSSVADQLHVPTSEQEKSSGSKQKPKPTVIGKVKVGKGKAKTADKGKAKAADLRQADPDPTPREPVHMEAGSTQDPWSITTCEEPSAVSEASIASAKPGRPAPPKPATSSRPAPARPPPLASPTGVPSSASTGKVSSEMSSAGSFPKSKKRTSVPREFAAVTADRSKTVAAAQSRRLAAKRSKAKERAISLRDKHRQREESGEGIGAEQSPTSFDSPVQSHGPSASAPGLGARSHSPESPTRSYSPGSSNSSDQPSTSHTKKQNTAGKNVDVKATEVPPKSKDIYSVVKQSEEISLENLKEKPTKEKPTKEKPTPAKMPALVDHRAVKEKAFKSSTKETAVKSSTKETAVKSSVKEKPFKSSVKEKISKRPVKASDRPLPAYAVPLEEDTGPKVVFPFGSNKAALATARRLDQTAIADAFKDSGSRDPPTVRKTFSSEFLAESANNGDSTSHKIDLMDIAMESKPSAPLREKSNTTELLLAVSELRSTTKEDDKTYEDRENSGSGSESEEEEADKSAQWRDFEAMTARITSTVQKTQVNLQKITSQTNITKVSPVDGLIREPLPEPTKLGAWEHIDAASSQGDKSDQDDNNDTFGDGFDETFDPEDKIALAFGSVKKPKTCGVSGKTDEVVEEAFNDSYEPQLVADDGLADAFGDGYLASRKVCSEEFEDSFGASAEELVAGAEASGVDNGASATANKCKSEVKDCSSLNTKVIDKRDTVRTSKLTAADSSMSHTKPTAEPISVDSLLLMDEHSETADATHSKSENICIIDGLLSSVSAPSKAVTCDTTATSDLLYDATSDMLCDVPIVVPISLDSLDTAFIIDCPSATPASADLLSDTLLSERITSNSPLADTLLSATSLADATATKRVSSSPLPEVLSGELSCLSNTSAIQQLAPDPLGGDLLCSLTLEETSADSGQRQGETTSLDYLLQLVDSTAQKMSDHLPMMPPPPYLDERETLSDPLEGFSMPTPAPPSPSPAEQEDIATEGDTVLDAFSLFASAPATVADGLTIRTADETAADLSNTTVACADNLNSGATHDDSVVSAAVCGDLISGHKADTGDLISSASSEACISINQREGECQPVLINIIAASCEHITTPDEELPGSIVQEDDVSSDSASPVADDFEELMRRPDAEKIENVNLSKVNSGTWSNAAGADDQTEFKADFDGVGSTAFEQTSAAALVASAGDMFAGPDPFACLVESAADRTDGMDCSVESNAKFAQTFSETIDEDSHSEEEDDEDEEQRTGVLISIGDSGDIPKKARNSKKKKLKNQGQSGKAVKKTSAAVMDPGDETPVPQGESTKPNGEDADDNGNGDSSDEADDGKPKVLKVSLMDVEVDMSKPMPLPARLTDSKGRAALKKKSLQPKPQPSSIHLVSQAERKVLLTQTSPVPRPKSKRTEIPANDAAVSPVSPRKSNHIAPTSNDIKGKRLLTQGQADKLTLSQQRDTISLNFQIGGGASQSGDNSSDGGQSAGEPLAADVPLLPPPSAAATLSTRAKIDSSDSETDDDDGHTAVESKSNQNTVDGATVALAGSLPSAGKELSGEEKAAQEVEEAERAKLVWKFEEPDLPPLEPFRTKFTGHGWTVLLRKPPKKSITKKRFWEEAYARLRLNAKGVPALQFYRNEKDARKVGADGEEVELPLQEIVLNPCHRLSKAVKLQQYDHYGKCHCIKLEHIFYKERPGLKKDRVAEALPGFLKGLKRPKSKMVFEHAAQKTEMAKLGCVSEEGMRSLFGELQDAFMTLKDVRLNTNTMYQKDEISADAWDEYEALVDKKGHIVHHKCRVRLFMLCFLSGMPTVEVGINEVRRKGKEIVGRKDIIAVKADSWISVEEPECHSIVKRDVFDETGLLRFSPMDGSTFEFLRFRYRPKKNRELPLQLEAKMIVDRKKRIIEIRGEALVAGYYSNSKRKGQVPCEDIQICFPVPEEWIYKFRVEKHFKYGSLHAASRRPGRIKGLERITTAVGKAVEGYLPPSFIECSAGDAKYEHVFKSVVWRVDRLPHRNQGAYKAHHFSLRLSLEPHDVIPESFPDKVSVSFTMPHTTVSGTAIRSISISNMASEELPEKWVHHHARFNMEVEIEFGDEIKEFLPTDNFGSDDHMNSRDAAAAASGRTEEDDFGDGGGSSDSDRTSAASDDDNDDNENAMMGEASGNAAAANTADYNQIEGSVPVDTLIRLDSVTSIDKRPVGKRPSRDIDSLKPIDGSSEGESVEESDSDEEGDDEDDEGQNGVAAEQSKKEDVPKLLDL